MLDGLRAAVPYNVHLGLEFQEIEPGRCVVVLPDDGRLHNHLGTQHGAGLFSVAEAASGGAFVAAFAEQLAELRPVVTRAEIDFVKLARGAITAEARLTEPLDAIVQRLEAEGVTRLEAGVTLRDVDGNEVARMTAHWRLKRSAPAASAE